MYKSYLLAQVLEKIFFTCVRLWENTFCEQRYPPPKRPLDVMKGVSTSAPLASALFCHQAVVAK